MLRRLGFSSPASALTCKYKKRFTRNKFIYRSWNERTGFFDTRTYGMLEGWREERVKTTSLTFISTCWPHVHIHTCKYVYSYIDKGLGISKPARENSLLVITNCNFAVVFCHVAADANAALLVFVYKNGDGYRTAIYANCHPIALRSVSNNLWIVEENFEIISFQYIRIRGYTRIDDENRVDWG